MPDGLVELWDAGRHNGAIIGATLTALAFTVTIGGYNLIKRAIENRRVKKALMEIKTSAVSTSASDEDGTGAPPAVIA